MVHVAYGVELARNRNTTFVDLFRYVRDDLFHRERNVDMADLFHIVRDVFWNNRFNIIWDINALLNDFVHVVRNWTIHKPLHRVWYLTFDWVWHVHWCWYTHWSLHDSLYRHVNRYSNGLLNQSLERNRYLHWYGYLYGTRYLNDLFHQLFNWIRYILPYEPFNRNRYTSIYDLFDRSRYTIRCGDTDSSWHRHVFCHDSFDGYRNVACYSAFNWVWNRYLVESFYRYWNSSIDKLLVWYRNADIFVDEYIVGLRNCALNRSVNRNGYLSCESVIHIHWIWSLHSPLNGNWHRHALRDWYCVRSVNSVRYDVIYWIGYGTINRTGNGVWCRAVYYSRNSVRHGHGLRNSSLNWNRNIVWMFDDLVYRHRVVTFNEFFHVVWNVVYRGSLH